MLLEMVGGRKNVIADASHTSEIYFPHRVYNRLELGTNWDLISILLTKQKCKIHCSVNYQLVLAFSALGGFENRDFYPLW